MNLLKNLKNKLSTIEDNWKEIIDFNKIQKGGVNIEDVLACL